MVRIIARVYSFHLLLLLEFFDENSAHVLYEIAPILMETICETFDIFLVNESEIL